MHTQDVKQVTVYEKFQSGFKPRHSADKALLNM